VSYGRSKPASFSSDPVCRLHLHRQAARLPPLGCTSIYNLWWHKAPPGAAAVAEGRAGPATASIGLDGHDEQKRERKRRKREEREKEKSTCGSHCHVSSM
jgi:hypothetical protein